MNDKVSQMSHCVEQWQHLRNRCKNHHFIDYLFGYLSDISVASVIVFSGIKTIWK